MTRAKSEMERPVLKHHMPGRTRLVIPHEQRRLLSAALEHPRVNSITETPISVVVHHDLELEELLAHLEAVGISRLIGLPETADALEGLGLPLLSFLLILAGGLYWVRL